jgi:anti-sigma factor RsiW
MASSALGECSPNCGKGRSAPSTKERRWKGAGTRFQNLFQLTKLGESRKHSSILDDRTDRVKVAPIRQRLEGIPHASLQEAIDCIAQRDCEMKHDAGIAITIGDASCAAVSHQRRFSKVPHRAHPLVPSVTAPHIVVPVHVEALIPAVTNKTLRLSTQVPFHVGDRSPRIVDGESAAQVVDSLEPPRSVRVS